MFESLKVAEDIDDYQLDFEKESSNALRSVTTSKTSEKTFMTADQLTTDTTTTISILKNRKSYYPSSGRSFIQPRLSKYSFQNDDAWWRFCASQSAGELETSF